MRLYHSLRLVSRSSERLLLLLISISLLLISACAAPQVTQALIEVEIRADGSSTKLQVPAGSSAQQVLEASNVELSALDRTEPPLYTLMSAGDVLQVVRVTEEFQIEQVTLPFDRQTLRNEALPDGESRLIQAGANGSQEITYRLVFEDGAEISRNAVKVITVKEPLPEIVMIGNQRPFISLEIPGRIAYLVSGSAWVMEGSTGERRPVVSSGDLDGRVFRLSRDGEWLLFTRKSAEEGEINGLWAARIDPENPLELDLEGRNIVHFADWVPDTVLRVAYSTVEPRAAAPGWQANNDLIYASFSTSGWVSRPAVVVDANSGGIYGWWGTTYAWSPGGTRLAFARPDGIGLVDIETGALNKIYDITPLQTFGDWAWVPALGWTPDGASLYTVDHPPQPGNASAEASTLFDLAAVPVENGVPVRLANQTGMFAYPAPSPAQVLASGENAFQIAYLQAIFPDQSNESGYRLMVMDRDGSNRQVLFPIEGASGLEPQQVQWSPQILASGSLGIVYLYEGNLWLLEVDSATPYQLTGDGFITRLDWR